MNEGIRAAYHMVRGEKFPRSKLGEERRKGFLRKGGKMGEDHLGSKYT